jgi:hypothetical protein
MPDENPWDEVTQGTPTGAIPAFDPRKHLHTDPRDAALEARDRPTWRPASDLPRPRPQPGFVFRWVRTSANSQNDTRNVSNRLTEGWEPVPATAQPDMVRSLGRYGTNADGNIEIGGLLLCRLPQETRDARSEYYGRAARSQVKAVDNMYMREQDPRMPKMAPEHTTQVSTGR